MLKFTSFTRILVLLLLGSNIFAQQKGQKLCVTPQAGSQNCNQASEIPITSAQNTFLFNTQDATPATVAEPTSWHKGFWLLGDGRYKKFRDDNTTRDAASRSANYTYSFADTYNPQVFLTEKYINSVPPDAPFRQVAVTGTANPPSTDENAGDIDATHKIHVNFSQLPRPKYPVVLPITFPNDYPVKNVVLLYNNFPDGTTKEWMAQDKVLLPNYYRGRATAQWGLASAITSNFPNLTGATLSGVFKRYMRIAVDSPLVDRVPSGGVKRVFPLLNTNAIGTSTIPREPLVFLAMLTGKEPLPTDQAQQLGNTIATFMGKQPNLPPDLALNGQKTEYIVGIDTIQLRLVASHDPNSLTVQKIEDAGSGNLRVTFRLKICNDGDVPEEEMTIKVSNVSGASFRGFNLTNLDGGIPSNLTGNNPWEFRLQNFHIDAVPEPYEPKCKSLEFTLDTDEAGLRKLEASVPHALEACVQFAGAVAGEWICCVNDSIAASNFKPFPPIKKDDGKCDWLWIMFAGLLGLGILGLLIGLLFKKKKN